MNAQAPTTTQVDFSRMTRDELVAFRRHIIAMLRILDMLLGINNR